MIENVKKTDVNTGEMIKGNLQENVGMIDSHGGGLYFFFVLQTSNGPTPTAEAQRGRQAE